MNIDTIGQLVTALLQFDQSMPILVSRMDNKGYNSIAITNHMIYHVLPNETVNSEIEFHDCGKGVEGSFDAFVL